MNLLNQKIQALRLTIEAERKQSHPDWVRIEKLSNELNDCLDQVGDVIR